MLVIGEDAELAVALRDRLDRAYVTVCEVRPPEAEAAIQFCRPWPWMVVGTDAAVPAPALRLLAGCPTLMIWRGGPPPGLSANTRVVKLFSELAETAQAAISGSAGGMRLAPGSGLTMPDGRHLSSPSLEALVAVHPCGLFAAARHFRGVSAALASRGVPLHLQTGRGGMRVLAKES